MDSSRLSSLALVGLAVALVQPATACAEEPSLSEQLEMGRKFQASCMQCHRQPDLRFSTDRAWLRQVHDTA